MIYITTQNYDETLRFVKFKRRLTKNFAKNTIVDKYENRILDLIKKNPDLQKHIKDTYFQDFYNL